MKIKFLTKITAITVVLAALFSGCGKAGYGDEEAAMKEENTIVASVEEVPEPMVAEDIMAKAIEQFENQDHTPSEEPVVHKMLWLGYTRVIYNELDLRMDEASKELFENVVYNFEHVVEYRAQNNVDIEIDYYFIDETRELTLDEYDDYLYLAHDTISEDIAKYNEGGKYDSVITAVQSQGVDNYNRNGHLDEYHETLVITGVCEKTIDFEQYGYSTFDLGDPEFQIMFDDPTIPALNATAVAVHEWMHQYENIMYLLKIEFPFVHAYMGEPDYYGYKTYEFGANGYYDFFEFYDQWLSGTVPYTGEDGVEIQVGMYPEMWKFTTLEFWAAYGKPLELVLEYEPDWDEEDYVEDWEEYEDENYDEYYDEEYYEEEY